MSGSTLGTLFRVTNFGESHGPAIGCVVDGCPPGMALSEADIQPELDRRRPGTSRHVTQRQEADKVEILSGVFEGRTTGTPIALLIRNTDQRSKDYTNLLDTFRPGHADYTYHHKYGLRDPRWRSRVGAADGAVAGAAAIARKWLRALRHHLRRAPDADRHGRDPVRGRGHVANNPFFAANVATSRASRPTCRKDDATAAAPMPSRAAFRSAWTSRSRQVAGIAHAMVGMRV
jgi:chorismate synthase